ncbi:MAG: M1 family metallopeptidase [Actinomycetota bacterium]
MAAFPRAAALVVVLGLALAACTDRADAHRPESSPVAGIGPPAGTVTRTPGEPATIASLRGDRRGTTWSGTQRIAFTNVGAAALPRIWLRLWSNGPDGCRPLAIRIQVRAGGTLGAARRACTAYPVDLAQPLAAGERAAVELSVRIRVPERNDRFGAHGGVSLLGGALPVLAVKDDAGWHLDPYVDLGEAFYSITGTYRVTLNVPDALDTAATGQIVRRVANGRREARTYLAQDVRDFAFAAAAFVHLRSQANGTDVHVWFRPSLVSRQKAERVLRNAVTSLEVFDEAFGAYPYPEVDLVVSAFDTFGGMEYPQIVFTNPDRFTVAHELAHQWWWGIVGDDEFAEPWLDESLATWSMYLPYSAWRDCDSFRWPSAGARLDNGMDYWRDHMNEYLTIYMGGGCMLAQLASRFGLARFQDLLGAYAASRWLDVARTHDFTAVIEEAAAEVPGFDVAAFWEHWRLDPA